MGIFDKIARVKNIVSGSVNDQIDSLENPETLVRETIRNMELELEKMADVLGTAIANENNLLKKHQEAKAEVEVWTKRAEQAVRTNQEDLAKEALRKKILNQDVVGQFEKLLDEAKITSDKIRYQVKQMQEKLEETKIKQTAIVAKSQSAKAMMQYAKVAGDLSESAAGNLKRMEEKVDLNVSKAEALSEIAGTETIEKKMEKLDQDAEIFAELEKLKGQIGS